MVTLYHTNQFFRVWDLVQKLPTIDEKGDLISNTTLRCRFKISSPSGFHGPTGALALSSDGSLLGIGYQNAKVALWDLDSPTDKLGGGVLLATVPWKASVHKIIFTTDNQNHQQQILAVDYKDHRVVVANSTTKTTTGLTLLDEETGHGVPLKDI